MEINGINTFRSSVLIVDDNTNNIQAVGTFLKQNGISLSIATSGAKALEAVKAKAKPSGMYKSMKSSNRLVYQPTP